MLRMKSRKRLLLSAAIGAVLSATPLFVSQSAYAQDAVSAYQVPQEKLASFLDQYFGGKFSGAVLIAQHGEAVRAESYGLANIEAGTPNTLDTVFNVSDFTEYFTAVAVLKLVEDGKLSLNDTLPKFFEGVPKGKQNVTLHHLLTHTSGFLSEGDLDAFEHVSEEDFLEDIFSRKNTVNPAVYLPKFTFLPGDRVVQFHEGYNLLAKIIEKASGQTYQDYLAEAVFAPAGMHNTGYLLPNWQPGQLANGYSAEGQAKWGNVPERLKVSGGQVSPYMLGSMGMSSTLPDLLAWHKALMGGQIVSKESLALLHMQHAARSVVADADIYQGYGIGLAETWTGTPWHLNLSSNLTHKNIPGFRLRYFYFPEEDIVVLSAENSHTEAFNGNAYLHLARTLLEPNYNAPLVSVNAQDKGAE